MTDLLKHGVVIACYFSLYELELDLWSLVLALPRHQADACPDRSALHSPKSSSVWVFIELRGNEFSLFCGECSASRILEQTWWLAEAYCWLHLVQSHTKVWLVIRWLGFQFAFLPIEAAGCSWLDWGVHAQSLALFFSASLLINAVFACSP